MTAPTSLPKSLAARVRAGVALLDEYAPDWHARVSVNRLDLTSQCRCVLGQYFGTYNAGLCELDLYYTCTFYGFDAVNSDDYRGLHRLWSFVIRQRQAVAS